MDTSPIRRPGRAAPHDRHRLRQAREDRGWNQRKLARRSGISQQQISALESGVNGASPETIAALARALGLQIEDLLTRPDTDQAAS